MAVHDPDGTTIASRSAIARSVRRATRRASAAKPLFHAGWPQHVAPGMGTVSTPAARSTAAASRTTCGWTASPRQVGKSPIIAGMIRE